MLNIFSKKTGFFMSIIASLVYPHKILYRCLSVQEKHEEKEKKEKCAIFEASHAAKCRLLVFAVRSASLLELW